MIYLDEASTAQYKNIDDIVVDTITTAMRDSWLNPSSLYAANVKTKIDKCRTNIASFIGAKSDEIYFTSGASESNNWAIRGWVDDVLTDGILSKNAIVITTPIEHKSIIEAVKNLPYGVAYYCDVDEYGIVDMGSLENWLNAFKNCPCLVSICMANNEIGTIQPIKEIAELVHKYNGVLHVDATQVVSHVPINVEELGVDMLSASGHKISPVLRGIGFLYIKKCINIQPLIYGNQENQMRGGTENTYGIIGLNKAIEYCDISREKIDKIIKKRNYFIELLEEKFDCELNGDSYYRLPNNINVTFPQNITGESLLYMLDMSSIRISTGSACNSKSIEPSHVLKAIGLSDQDAMKTVRFTLPDDITYEDIDFVINEIDKTIKVIEVN